VSLFDWLTDPPDARGLRVLDRRTLEWHFASYRTLAALTRRAAARLRDRGVGPGDVVIVVRSASHEFLADFFGALLLGATPSPVAPPVTFRSRDAYLAHLRRLIRLVDARAVATSEEDRAVIAAAVPPGCAVVTAIPEDIEPVAGPPVPPEYGLLQWSSGSTGAPRGVRIPFGALQANVTALYEWLRIDDSDGYASWLPLHHDMGLIGVFLLPVEGRSDLWLMRPEEFIRSPARWLRCFAEGATMTASPTFGLSQVLARTTPAQLDGLDLSRWKGVIVGAERIDATVVRRFCDLLAPHGVRRTVVIPAYGLAEATLAVTGAPVGAPLRTVDVDPSGLRPGHPVTYLPGDPAAASMVGCGTPLTGVRVRIVGPDGRPVGDDTLGEISVSGVSLAEARIGDETGVEPVGDTLMTGDAGFRHDGWLYVVGRLGDGVKRDGRWFFAEDAERVATRASPRPRQTVALVGDAHGRATVAVLVEGRLTGGVEELGRAVARHCAGLRVQVFAVPAGTIQRTTSGKPKRRAMWDRLLTGVLADALRWDSTVDVSGTAIVRG